MRICPQCAAPLGPTGCLFCGPGLRAEEGVQAQWHVSSSLRPPPPAARSQAPPVRGPSESGATLSISERMAAEGLVFPARAPNCYDCVHFEITHQPVFPRACALLGFKGRELPSHFLFNVSGKNCPWFVARSSEG